MKKIREDMLPEYDFATLRERPNRSARAARGTTHMVVVDKALWPHFGSAEAVNAALRAAVEIAKAVKTAKPKKRRAA
ncbi:MAG TPA: hypothetical protein VF316_10245 [Polyangiaceae bacterium]